MRLARISQLIRVVNRLLAFSRNPKFKFFDDSKYL